MGAPIQVAGKLVRTACTASLTSEIASRSWLVISAAPAPGHGWKISVEPRCWSSKLGDKLW
jgi:hypothetical protein